MSHETSQGAKQAIWKVLQSKKLQGTILEAFEGCATAVRSAWLKQGEE